MDTIFSQLAQLGIGGLMAAAMIWFLWYQNTKAFPKMLDTFREEINAERQVCRENHEKQMAEHHKTQDLLQQIERK